MCISGEVRMNISIPNELRERMDKTPHSPNWSAIAARAFREHVSTFELKKGTGERMSKVAERLQASKAAFDEECKAFGNEDGRDWAEAHADYPELLAVSRIDPSTLNDKEDVFSAIDPDFLGNWDMEYVEEKFFGRTSLYTNSVTYLEAWVEGVKAVFDEVKDQL